MADFLPDLSHRYLAGRSGVGWFGLSGNVITREHGAAVVLGSVVTTAELEPTEPLPPDEKYCDECQLCRASCTSGLMARKERTTVTMGGMEFSYSERRSYHRPGRFPIPDKDEDFMPALIEAVGASAPRPQIEGGFHHPAMPRGRVINMTCGNCQLVCHPDRDERKRRYKLLTRNGVVVQNPDGSLETVSPEIAEKRLGEMPEEQRAWYEKS
jgi:ferredoxin